MAEKAGKQGDFYAQDGSATSVTTGPIGTGSASGVHFFCIEEINDCEATTDWSGTSLSTDAGDYKEGTKSLKDTNAAPAATTEYETTYDPSGTWDMTDRTKMAFWFKCDRASTEFTHARLYLEDSGGDASYWDLTFAADTWTRFNKDIHSEDGNNGTTVDVTDIDKIIINIKAADTTAYYILLDWVGYTPNMARAGFILYNAGTAEPKWKYSITPSGAVTYNAADAPADAAAITATYDYYDVAQVGGCFSWSVDNTCEIHETTDFADDGVKTYIAGPTTWSGSAEAHWISDDLRGSWLGSEMILKMYLDDTTTPKERYEGWGIISGLNPSVAVDALIDEPISFQGTDELQYTVS